MFLITPISKQRINEIYTFSNSVNSKYTQIKICIDLQNIAVGKYYPDQLVQYYNSNLSEIDVAKKLQNEILEVVATKVFYFKQLDSSAFVYLFNDKGRNSFNKNLINEWKIDRQKSWLNLKQKNSNQYEASSWFNSIYSVAIDSVQKLCNTSFRCKIINLEYIDSDFLPNTLILLDKYLGTYDNTIYVVVSNDHDYLHLTNYDNVILYVPTDKQNKILQKYTVFNRFRKKFNLKTFNDDSYKYISKVYPIIHSLIGDSTDSIPSLIKGKGISYWLKELYKKLGDNYNKIDYSNIRQQIIDQSISIVPQEYYSKFLNRYFITDFYFVSLWIIGNLLYNKLDEYDKYIFDLTFPKLNMELKNIIKLNSEIISKTLINNKHISLESAVQILVNFNNLNKEQANFVGAQLWV